MAQVCNIGRSLKEMEMEDDRKVKTTRKAKDGHGDVIGESAKSGDGFRHVVETFLEKFTHRQTVIIEKWNKVETTRREIMETVVEAWEVDRGWVPLATQLKVGRTRQAELELPASLCKEQASLSSHRTANTTSW